MNDPLVTVIVCTFNRAEMLSTALTSLLSQRTPSLGNWEILVVDNCSTDNTPHVLHRFAKQHPSRIRWVHEMEPGIAAARNRGVAEARGTWLAFFDDDQIASDMWLESLLEFARRTHADCVAGEVRLRFAPDLLPLNDISKSIFKLLGGTNPVVAPTQLEGRQLPGAGNVLVHRDVFAKVGEFDKNLVEGGEDNDFFRRARVAGFACWLIPNASVDHCIPPERITAPALQAAAQRMGWYLGRIQALDEGLFRTLFSVVLRCAYHLLTTLPKLILARNQVRPDTFRTTKWPQPTPGCSASESTMNQNQLLASSLRKGSRLEASCELHRFRGYLHSVAHHLCPRIVTGQKFRGRYVFRREHDISSRPS